MKDNIKLFEDKKIRLVWNEAEEEWYFAVSTMGTVRRNNIDYY